MMTSVEGDGDEVLKRLVLDSIASIVEPHSALYVAGPLATGREFYRILSGGGVGRPNVRLQNEIAMRAFASQLRARQRRPVIDPSVLTVDGWSATQIGDLFITIIEHFACELWFMDGWEFSSGATKEFGYALNAGKVCLSASGDPISRELGLSLIMSAAQQLDAWGVVSHKLHFRIDQIRIVGVG